MSEQSRRGRDRAADAPSRAVVDAIAEREGVEPTELSPRLYDVIDPEALDSLFAPAETDTSRPTGTVRFSYNGYDVHVSSAGAVHVVETDGR